jgi:hypothetical protein
MKLKRSSQPSSSSVAESYGFHQRCIQAEDPHARPFARASRTISRPVPPVAPKQEPSCSISIFIGVNVAVIVLWEASDRVCDKRQMALLPICCPLWSAKDI